MLQMLERDDFPPLIAALEDALSGTNG